MAKYKDIMQEFSMVAKAISDESRARILMMLSTGELCVCQVIEVLGLAPSTVSKHLSILRQAGLIEARKEGRWIYYRISNKITDPMIKKAYDWVYGSLAKDSQVRSDLKKLTAVLEDGKEQLCSQVVQK